MDNFVCLAQGGILNKPCSYHLHHLAHIHVPLTTVLNADPSTIRPALLHAAVIKRIVNALKPLRACEPREPAAHLEALGHADARVVARHAAPVLAGVLDARVVGRALYRPVLGVAAAGGIGGRWGAGGWGRGGGGGEGEGEEGGCDGEKAHLAGLAVGEDVGVYCKLR